MQIQLEGSLTAPRDARQFVNDQWRSLSPAVSAIQDDVILVASELVTNAVEAGARQIVVQVRADETRLELTVSDDAPGWPTEQQPSPQDTRGRGLFITTQLAARWTATENPTGKTITATWELNAR